MERNEVDPGVKAAKIVELSYDFMCNTSISIARIPFCMIFVGSPSATFKVLLSGTWVVKSISTAAWHVEIAI